MRSVQSLLGKFLLALILLGGPGAVLAGPDYHVSLDTSAFAGNGFLDLYFSRQAGAPQSSVTVSNFNGLLGAQERVSGDVSGAIPGTVVFGSTDGESDLLQAVTLGGLFSFDLSFSGDFPSTRSEIVSLFGVGLLNDRLTAYLGADTDLLQFSLVPMLGAGAPSAAGVSYAAFGDIAVVTAVPEPAELALMLIGLALLGFVARRRAR